MSFPAELFSRSAREMEQFFSASHYIMSDITVNDVSAMRYVDFKNAEAYFRFVWNDAQQWLAIVKHNDLQGETQDEIFFRSLTNASDADKEHAVRDAINLMQNYFSHTHDEEENCCACSHHHA